MDSRRSTSSSWERIERTKGQFPPFDPQGRLCAVSPRQAHGWRASASFWRVGGSAWPRASRATARPETVHGLANRKNEVLRRRIEEGGRDRVRRLALVPETVREAGVPYGGRLREREHGTILERAGSRRSWSATSTATRWSRITCAAKPEPDTLLRCMRRARGRARARARRSRRPRRGSTRRAQRSSPVVIGIDQFGQDAALRAPGAAPVAPGWPRSSTSGSRRERRMRQRTMTRLRRRERSDTERSACRRRSARACSTWTASSPGRTRVHAAAWKEMFDDYLRARAERRASRSSRSTPAPTTLRFVDGKTRADGVRSFLASRGDRAAGGQPRRPAGRGDGRRARQPQERARARAHQRETASRCTRARSRFVHAVRAAGLRCGRRLVERQLPRRARGGADRRPLRRRGRRRRRRRSDNSRASRLRTRSSPPRSALGVEPADAAVFEDAQAGVEAGRAGRLRLRRRGRPRRQAGCPSRARRRRRGRRPREMLDASADAPSTYAVEPWSIRETALDLDDARAVASRSSRSRTVTSACAANLDEGEPFEVPGTYLNSLLRAAAVAATPRPDTAIPSPARRSST